MRESLYLLPILLFEALECPSLENGQRRSLTQNMQLFLAATLARSYWMTIHMSTAASTVVYILTSD